MNYWQTERLRLRAIEPGDAESFYRWNLDSERARALDFVWPPSSHAREQAFADQASKKSMENESFHWIIETLDGEPVGTIATHDCSLRNGTFSYGVDISADQRGKGYAAEAIWRVLRWYFEELRYQKVTVVVHADNPGSLRLHEKLGFQREGVLRRMMYTGGKYVDIIYMGLTREEYEEMDRQKVIK